MKQHSAMALLPLAVLVLLPSLVFADSYRCGRKIVRSGDPVSRLLALCGEPRRKDSGSETIEVSGVPRKVKVQRWYYKRGSRRLERVVFVYRGKIAAIEVGGR
jgi:hypothetical protein